LSNVKIAGKDIPVFVIWKDIGHRIVWNVTLLLLKGACKKNIRFFRCHLERKEKLGFIGTNGIGDKDRAS